MPDNEKAQGNSWYQLVKLGQEHLEQIMELQSLIRGQLNNKELCLYVSRDEFREMLGEKGIVLGAIVGGKVVAIFSALFPGEKNPENLGTVLGLPDDELIRVGHLEIAFNHPDYRGKDLYYQMGEQIISILRTGSSVRHLCSTIDPKNIPPLKKSLLLDMQIVKINEMYDGLARFILYQDLNRPARWEDNKVVRIDLKDLNRQQQLLQSGWRGVSFIQETDAAFIEYRKLSTNGG